MLRRPSRSVDRCGFRLCSCELLLVFSVSSFFSPLGLSFPTAMESCGFFNCIDEREGGGRALT